MTAYGMPGGRRFLFLALALILMSGALTGCQLSNVREATPPSPTVAPSIPTPAPPPTVETRNTPTAVSVSNSGSPSEGGTGTSPDTGTSTSPDTGTSTSPDTGPAPSSGSTAPSAGSNGAPVNGPLADDQAIVQVVEKLGPAVVTVINTLDSSAGYGQQASGSGVIIDERGYVVTNNHVVEGQQSLD